MPNTNFSSAQNGNLGNYLRFGARDNHIFGVAARNRGKSSVFLLEYVFNYHGNVFKATPLPISLSLSPPLVISPIVNVRTK